VEQHQQAQTAEQVVQVLMLTQHGQQSQVQVQAVIMQVVAAVTVVQVQVAQAVQVAAVQVQMVRLAVLMGFLKLAVAQVAVMRAIKKLVGLDGLLFVIQIRSQQLHQQLDHLEFMLVVGIVTTDGLEAGA
jgi:hypothetical protein